ncbi:CBM96 family carbohydrate-binding protein [Pontiella sulfatireligans]|uniref:Probable pectate lyase C n=1 Tax=Pontiella sulfatireligans TaxID=2750658 RepID=A0A6C2UUW1_9BACT|nr:DNRLRE domain-containing protein [Pontiella sulfatireligans]VGO23171.1 hypothetical protein SCARR_05276 [Pontiella sulfatireligans]
MKKAMLIALVLFAGPFAVQVKAVLLAYEGFDYVATTGPDQVEGLNGGSGFGSAWVNSQPDTGDANFSIVSGGDSWGGLGIAGNRLKRTSTGGTEYLARPLSGDLDAAPELWFSVIIRPSQNEGFAIAGSALAEDGSAPDNTVDGNAGFGFVNSDNINLVAAVWNNAGARLDGTSLLLTGVDISQFIVGKISFNSGGSGEDVLSLYSVGTDLVLPGVPGATVQADLDETVLDTLTIESNRGPGYDEIRIGTSYADVTPGLLPVGDYYVATNGSDSASGSLEAPFASIQHAVDTMSPGSTVYVRGGRYHEEVSIDTAVGLEEGSFCIRNYPGEQPVIDGTIPILGTWTPTNLNGHSVWVTSVEQDIWQLFVDDRMQVVARWPNVTVGHPCDPIQLQDDDCTPVEGTWWDIGTWGDMDSSWNAAGILTNNAAAHDLAGEGVSFAGGSIVLNFHSESQFSRNILTHEAGSNVLVHEPVVNPYDKGSGPFLIEHLNALDIPGEWYYDMDSGLVYFWPLDGLDPNNLNLFGKTISYGITMRDSQYVSIENIDFFASTVDIMDSEYITIDDCKFSYPTWFRRMLSEHTYNMAGAPLSARPEPMGEGGTFFQGNSGGSYNTLRNCIFEYSDGLVDMYNGYGNVVDNNLFHHWSFTGMASYILNMNSSPESVQRRNTFHTNGSKVMSKHSGADVEYSRASWFGYFQMDGSAWQCAGGDGWGGPSDGLRRHHNWHHQAMKSGFRWDGFDGYNGWNDHVVSWNVPSSLMIKGDYHQTHNNTSFQLHDPVDNAMRVLDDNESVPLEERNANSHTYNNLAESISGARSGYVPLNGHEAGNWNGYLHTTPGDTADKQLRDPANLDFRPKEGSVLIDAGVVVTDLITPMPPQATVLADITEGYLGSAPDIGAYEYGDTHYWIPGYQSAEASTPVPPDGSTTVKPDADLMWLEGRDSVSHNVHFGTNSGSLAFLTNQTNNIFDPGELLADQRYYWRVDTVTATGTVTGAEWSFVPGEPVFLAYKRLVPDGDTYVAMETPDANFGASETIAMASYVDLTYVRHGYMRFDVDVTNPVVSATLNIRNTDGATAGNVGILTMTDTSWNEMTMTWNTKPDIDGVLLDRQDVVGGTWQAFDVSGGVTADGLVSFGLIRDPGDSRRSVLSRESAYPPVLEIEYQITEEEMGYPPVAPQNLVAAGRENQINLKWDANEEPFVVGYYIYRTDYLDDDFVQLNPIVVTTPSYTDTDVQLGVTYYYKVRALDQFGRFSSGSTYVNASPLEAGSFNWVELTYDDFEDGFGSYTDGGLDCMLYTSTDPLTNYAHQGVSAVNVQVSGEAASFFHTEGIDVHAPDYQQIKVEFWFMPISMDSGGPDGFLVQYYDGSEWQTVREYVTEIDFTNSVFQFEEVIIDEFDYNFHADMKIRFMCDANGGGDDVYFDEIRVTAAEAAGAESPYELWGSEYGLSSTDADYLADPDGDGLVNLAEYGLGGIPTNGSIDAAILPTFGKVEEGGTNWMEYIYRRRTDAAVRGLGYTVESTTSLLSNDWNTGGVIDAGSGPLETGFEVVTNRISTEFETNQFIRLRISIE